MGLVGSGGDMQTSAVLAFGILLDLDLEKVRDEPEGVRRLQP